RHPAGGGPSGRPACGGPSGGPAGGGPAGGLSGGPAMMSGTAQATTVSPSAGGSLAGGPAMMSGTAQATLRWRPGAGPPASAPAQIAACLRRIREPLAVIAGEAGGALGLALGGELAVTGGGYPLVGSLPPLYPEWLGDRRFCEEHGVRFPYVAGEMA